MDLGSVLWRIVVDRRVRLAFGLVAAFVWFWTIWTSELGRNGGLAFFYGIPAAVVLVVWRTRPWVALGLSVLTLILVLFGAANGTAVNSGGVLACSTAWFAVLGAALTRRRPLVWSAGSFALLDAVLSLVNNGVPSFLIVCFASGFGLVLGWSLSQARTSLGLRLGLAESTARQQAAERDVLLELERNRIAREVHDVVAHSLAVVIAQADGARFAAETKPESVVPALDAIGDTARRALGEIRTMLHDLKTTGDSVAPGPDDLAGLVEGVRGLGTEVDDAVFGAPRELGRDVGLALYRVAQEALTNAVRHGDRLRPIGFEVDWGEREVVLVVTNAVTDSALPASERAGHGIDGMRERAEDAGGDCTAGVGSNGRFRVRVALPVAPPQAEEAGVPAPDPFLSLFRVEPRAS